MHQEDATSSDLGFDLKLSVVVQDISSWLSTSAAYTTTLTGPQMLTAVFEPTGECILPDTIGEDMTLRRKNVPPDIVQGDVWVPANITLTIEPGVEIFMAPGSNMMINGNIDAEGTSGKRILFKMNPAYEGQCWGALCFSNTTNTNHMHHVTIEDASSGPVPTLGSSSHLGL